MSLSLSLSLDCSIIDERVQDGQLAEINVDFVSPASRHATSFPRATRIALVSVSRRIPIQIDRKNAFERRKINFFKKLALPIHIIGLKYLTT